MADRDIAVKFTGDASDLVRASEKAESSLADTGKSMGGGLAGLAGPAGIAAAAIAGVGFAAFSLADAAMEDEAAQSQLAFQMRQAAGASDEAIAGAEDYITVLSKQAAIADDELRPALSTLVTATGDVAKSQDLLALSTDIAAGTGKDLESVTNAMAKAQLGNTGALGKLGLATKDAAGNALTLDEILAGATDKFHGAGEAAAQTGAGGMKAAGIAFDELKESLGSKLLPILGGLGTVFTEKVIPAGEALVAWAENEWPKIMEQIGPSLAELQAQAAEVFANLQSFWDEWGDEITNVITTVVSVYIAYLVTELKVAFAFIGWLIASAKALWAEWGDRILTVVGWVVNTVQWVANVIGLAFAAIGFVIGKAVDVFHTLADVWEVVKDAVRRGVDFVRDLMSSFGARISDALRGVADIITKPFQAAFNAISDLWNNTIGKLSFTFPAWIPGMGGNTIDVPDIPRFSAFAGLTIVMPPGTDGYDIARQYSSFSRNVAPMGALTVAVR